MTYDECVAILKQFKSKHPLVMMNRSVQGVRVVEGEPPVIEVMVPKGWSEESLPNDERLPSSFTYSFQEQTRTIQIRTKESDIYYPQTGELADSGSRRLRATHSGDPARGQSLGGYGTAGWTIKLDGALVCISNWHVFCV